jgi:pyridoxine/pyridoxamine 5'-phosphate oxidase
MKPYEQYQSKIIIDESKYNELTEEQKKWFDHFIEKRQRELSSVNVIYRPTCGCPYEYTVLLDRFPMSKKIMIHCKDCKKGTFLEISDPIIFHFPWNKQDITLEELRKMEIMDSPQKPYLESYCFWSAIDYLEKKCKENEKQE